MISIDLSENTLKSALEIRDKLSPRQNAVQDKIQSKKISENFFRTKFFSNRILSWTEFCLGLHTAVVFRMQLFNFK